MSNKQQLKVQLTRALTHGHGHGTFVFLQYGQFSCDSNQTVTVLLGCLAELPPLPDVLYLQMDNCSGSNIMFLVFFTINFGTEENIQKGLANNSIIYT